MEEYLRDLGHARDGLDGEVSETVDGPGILVGFDETAAIWRISQEIESKLSVRFDRIDATREEKSWSSSLVVIDPSKFLRNLPVEVVVHPVNVICIHHCHCLRWNETPLFADGDSLILFGDTPVRRNTAPVSRLHLLSIPSRCVDLHRVTNNSMPDGYMLDVYVLISNFLDCVLQSVRKPILVGLKIGPAPIELVFSIFVLLFLVNI